MSDSRREFCGRRDRHPYEVLLQLKDIERRTTKVNRPQWDGLVEPFHRTLFDEHFRVEGRRNWFETIDEIQVALDKFLIAYNRKCRHQGRRTNGVTPWRAFQDGVPRTPKTNKMGEQEEGRAA